MMEATVAQPFRAALGALSRPEGLRYRRTWAVVHVLLMCVAALAAACSSGPKTSASVPSASTSQRISIGQLPTIDVDALLTHTRMLSSDEYEGRAPGTTGEELAVTYLGDQLKKVGLKP